MNRLRAPLLALCLVLAGLFAATDGSAARRADVRNSKHNLSSGAPGANTVRAAGTQAAGIDGTQVCVFCHTPHAAVTRDAGGVAVNAPLWNRRIPAGTTYTPYTSASLEAQSIIDGFKSQPGGSSKLCLSCHDGTLAIGNVAVMNGKLGNLDASTDDIAMSGTNAGKMPDGSGATSGFTRNLGQNLSNDHPISITYNSDLVTADGELRAIDASQRVTGATNVTGLPSGYNAAVGIRNSPAGTRPLLPLEKTGGASNTLGQIQCATCHDPHMVDPAVTDHSIKFLRANRFQVSAPAGGAYDAANDIICLACHDKAGTAWSASAHATGTAGVADKVYKNSGTPNPLALREFPNRATFKVWEASCLNCHDTHTVQGAKRLLREGTDSTANPKTGGNPATEETCFQCHRPFGDAAQVLSLTSQTVPDVLTDFGGPTGTGATFRMPLRSSETCANTEKHEIGTADTTLAVRQRTGKDFVEDPALLGRGNAGTCNTSNNRHVECTDCHNPHRAMKNSRYDGTGLTTQATHDHTAGTQHSNAASGALKGTTGVEPTYTAGAAFGTLPSGYTFLCGGVSSPSNCTTAVTKEYQICLKCHSDYAYTDTGGYNAAGRPPLAASTDTARKTTKTPYNQWINGDRYTNQAMEFQADQTGVPATNHRSWHPVVGPTGRTTALRGGIAATNFVAPFNTGVGSLTMYCSDCHGNNTAAGTAVPSAGQPWGPHGSTNPFILKGTWNTASGTGQANALCFKCHSQTVYTGSGTRTGFWTTTGKDGHFIHGADKLNSIRCNWCHIAVPHGWKNKALLVNLNDVGPEAGNATPQSLAGPYTKSPYYRNAMNRIRTFAASGSWADTNCGPPTGEAGRNWMTNTCSNPP